MSGLQPHCEWALGHGFDAPGMPFLLSARVPPHQHSITAASSPKRRPHPCTAAPPLQVSRVENSSTTAAEGAPLPPALPLLPLVPVFDTVMLRIAVHPTPPLRNLGALVEHLYLSDAEGPVSVLLETHLGLPPDVVDRLIWFGAVYSCPVVPVPPPASAGAIDASKRDRIAAWRVEGLQKHGKDPSLQAPRRVLPGSCVSGGAYFRVHLHPKRFPVACSEVDWASRIVAHDEGYVVVDKPAGLQVPPTVDNIKESLLAKVEEALGLSPGSLAPGHRLDVGTEGLVVLTKTKDFARWFQALIRDKQQRQIQKTYRCCTARPPPVGTLIHHLLEGQQLPGEPPHSLVVEESSENSCRAELHIKEVQLVHLTGQAAVDWGPTAFESEISLITGRTHQIRAQLAHIGCPLLGDDLYSALHELRERQQQAEAALPSAPGQQPLDGPSSPCASVQQPRAPDHQLQGAPSGSEATVSLPFSADSGSRGSPASQEGCSGGMSASDAGCRRPELTSIPEVGSEVQRWCRRMQEDPLKPLALQAAKLEVLVDGPMGTAPVVFEAGTPWWRAGD